MFLESISVGHDYLFLSRIFNNVFFQSWCLYKTIVGTTLMPPPPAAKLTQSLDLVAYMTFISVLVVNVTYSSLSTKYSNLIVTTQAIQ